MAEYDQILSNNQKIQLFDDLHLLQSIMQVYQTQDQTRHGIKDHTVFFW